MSKESELARGVGWADVYVMQHNGYEEHGRFINRADKFRGQPNIFSLILDDFLEYLDEANKDDILPGEQAVLDGFVGKGHSWTLADAESDSETKYELLGNADPDNAPEPVTKPLVCPYCGGSLHVSVDFNGYGGHAASMIECSNCMQGAWNADGTVM